eukprot:TRINITY_DN6154_c0_g2_i1.p1 TRINITY_DN6154_c0_g2~~TRINITY_DN6154_c0_g2_i1.p1  ORF type:complete len:308 (+),score=37.44 TRINITY_DN6154_c0_g2_i1:73-996(+)
MHSSPEVRIHQYEAIAEFRREMRVLQYPLEEKAFRDRAGELRETCLEGLEEGGKVEVLRLMGEEEEEFETMNKELLRLHVVTEGVKSSRLNEAYCVYQTMMGALELPMQQALFLAMHNESTVEAIRIMQHATREENIRLKDLIFESFKEFLLENDAKTATGFLMKRGDFRHSWKMRFFELSEKGISYTKDGEANSRGFINISEIVGVTEDSPHVPPQADISRLLEKTDFSAGEELCSTSSSLSSSLSLAPRDAVPPSWSFPFSVQTPKREFHLSAPTARHRTIWVSTICNVCRIHTVDPSLLMVKEG